MGAARAAFDAAKHPRGYHGRFGLGQALRHGEVEHEVFRGASDKPVKALRGQRKVAELKATARHKATMEDRAGQRLRWGEQIKGHWYMVKGSQYWVKQDSKPGWHNGYYYMPGKWHPVVPPRADWSTRTSYAGPPGTPLTSVVPDDVRLATSMYKEERTGRRMIGRGGDRTARGTQFEKRKARAGLGGSAGDYRQSKKFRGRKVKRKTARSQMSAAYKPRHGAG
jgi:hypothetical protein